MTQILIQEHERTDLDTLETFCGILTTMAAVEEEEECIRLLLTSIPALLQCRVSGMALRVETEEGWQLRLQQEGQHCPVMDTEKMRAVLDPFFGEALGKGILLLDHAENREGESSISPLLTQLGVHSLVIVPLRTLHNQIGVLFIGTPNHKPFARREIVLLHTLAEHLAIIAIENLRLHQQQRQYTHSVETQFDQCRVELRHSQEQYRVLLEINNAIISNLTQESLFQTITRVLSSILPFDRTTLTLYEPDRDSLRVFSLAGPSSPKYFGGVGTEVSRQKSHVGWVFDQQRPLLRRDLEHECQFPPEERMLTEGIRSYIIVPLTAKGKPLGTLNVGSETPHQYTEEDAAFLQEVAKQIALAVDNMRAYEEIATLKARLQEENLYLQEEIKTDYNFEEIVGKSPALQKVLQAAALVAETDATVLLLGETGTGKELIARAIHNLSPRKHRPLVKVNCAALPAGLIESELFGHEKGAFTGALARKIGRFELAHGGTILLDEIGELPLELQPKLLRVLQEGQFERVGGFRTITVDVRVIAATNRDLKRAVEEGRFRADFYYRLNVFPIHLPPLRERKEDIPLLVRYFVLKHSAKLGKRVETISHQTMEALLAYPWPGNVRELEHLIERALILTPGPQLNLEQWLSTLEPPPETQIQTLAEFERDYILKVLERTGWRVSGEKGAAKLLGLKPTTLEARMKKLGIKRKK